MADFSRVSPGDPDTKSPATSASWLNAVSEVAEDYQSRQEAGEAGGNDRALKASSGIVTVKNLTGSDVLRGQYVQLGAYLLTSVSHRRLLFEGNLYDSAESGRIAILSKAAKSNAFEPARTLGTCTARVNVSDTGHRFATPADGSATLVSAARGDIAILSANKITGTGVQELVVLLGAPSPTTIRKARVTTTITAATAADTWGSGTVQLKDETTGEPSGDAVDCDNEWPETFPADAMVSVNTSFSPYRVEGGTCTALSAETFWGDS